MHYHQPIFQQQRGPMNNPQPIFQHQTGPMHYPQAMVQHQKGQMNYTKPNGPQKFQETLMAQPIVITGIAYPEKYNDAQDV